MPSKTCAACDCELDASAVRVAVGGRTVEVCCEDCARKLREAYDDAEQRQYESSRIRTRRL
jgi:hypothetical protein